MKTYEKRQFVLTPRVGDALPLPTGEAADGKTAADPCPLYAHSLL